MGTDLLAALSPGVSWLLIGAVAVVAVVVYSALVVGGRSDDEWDRMDEEWLERYRRDHS